MKKLLCGLLIVLVVVILLFGSSLINSALSPLPYEKDTVLSIEKPITSYYGMTLKKTQLIEYAKIGKLQPGTLVRVDGDTLYTESGDGIMRVIILNGPFEGEPCWLGIPTTSKLLNEWFTVTATVTE